MKDEEESIKQESINNKHIEFSKNMLNYIKHTQIMLNDMTNTTNKMYSFGNKYTKENIINWLKSPSTYYDRLVEVSRFFYLNSQHYKRLIQYFGKMSKMAYVILPLNVNESKLDKEKFMKDYKNIINRTEVMNINREFSKLINLLFRDDCVYCYEYSLPNSYYIKTLPHKYCKITSINDGVFAFSFDFSYFNPKNKKKLLASYGNEFISKYKKYRNGKCNEFRWQELDPKCSFALKLSDDVDYPVPMFANLIPLLYDLDDIKTLDKVKKELDNYKLLVMQLRTNDEGRFIDDPNIFKEYFDMILETLPQNIGLTMSPSEMKEYTFDKNTTSSEISAYSKAITDFWSTSGVSELLFNGLKSSSATISNSIKCDTEIIFGVHRMIERVINRKLKNMTGDYKFKISILDVTYLNEKEYLDILLKANNYSVPVKLNICACLGYTPSDTYGATILEECLDLTNRWKPLQSSSTQSGKGEVGGQTKDDGELSESGEKSRENDNRKIE